MALNPYTQSEIDKASRTVRDLRGKPVTTPQQAQITKYQQLYGNDFWSTRTFDPAKASADLQKKYRDANPYSEYAKSADMRFLQKVDTARKNNTGVTASDNSFYNTVAKKWNYQDPSKGFQFNYNPLTYDQAQGQVSKQLDPIYQRALENVRAQKYQNELDAGQQAANRGLAHSGLAADLQNKVAIDAQNQIADMQAERAAQTAEMAQSLVQQDQNRELALRQQAYQEFADNRNMEYQQQQDVYQKQLDADNKAWREYTYKNMSASEKAQLEWAKSQYGEDAAWRMFELKYNGELSTAQNNTALSLYTQGFPTP